MVVSTSLLFLVTSYTGKHFNLIFVSETQSSLIGLNSHQLKSARLLRNICDKNRAVTSKFLSHRIRRKYEPGLTICKTDGSTLSTSIILLNSLLQNVKACSRVNPIPLRNRPYCIRPWWRMWWFSRNSVWSWRIHSGNDFLACCGIEHYRVYKRTICYRVLDYFFFMENSCQM